ncbi:MAG: TonB-dependent receptor [Acidobacteria bacterium]|nr:TonB-dependent receptor [Acidobacteriota bacterium]
MRSVWGTLLCLVVAGGCLSAQVSTGTINIEVQDGTGAVVPAAAITILRAGTGEVRRGTTNDRGAFRAAFMPIGEYTISAEAKGFKRKTLSGLQLRVDQDANLTITLDPGDVVETIEVTAVTPLLESSSASVGQVIENRKIVDLPLNGRNPFALGLLAGNTNPVFGMGTNMPFVGGGGRFGNNEVLLDGVDNNTIQNRGAIGRAGIAYTPSVDAVQEFKVKTNNFSAEFGKSAGTVVSATIKSGSNDFHGALFEFLRNDRLDANNFFTNAAGRPKAKFRQNQFGGALGGRILRDRTFFFGDYEGTRRRTAASSSIIGVPPEDFRRGDFSRYASTIYDPATRRIGPAGTVVAEPFAGNRIPQSRINPTSAAITGLVPLPNFGSSDAQSRNYFRQAARGTDRDRWDLRVDHRLSASNNLYVRYSSSEESEPSPGRFEGFIGGGSTFSNVTRHVVLNDTHVFSPGVVNEFRFGYARHDDSQVGDAPEGVPFADQNRLALFPFPVRGFPQLVFAYSGSISGSAQFDSWGGGGSNLNIENTFQWADNVNIMRGNHTLKIGGDFRRYRYEVLKGSPFFGEMIFGSIFSSSSDAPGSGAPFADFLMGFPSTLQGTQMLDWGRHRWIYAAPYFQDDWKLAPRLTLNLGIRYDLFTQPVDARDRGSLFDPKRGRFQIPGQDGFSRAIVNGDHNNIAPRVGFAWQVRPKLVVRGGYGMFYGLRDQNQETSQFSGNNPNTPDLSVPVVNAARTVAPPMTLSTPIVALPSDTTLQSFTPQRPFVRTIRTQLFEHSRFPLLHQFNVSFQYEPFASWLFELNLIGSRGRDLATAFLHYNQVPFEYAIEGRNTQANRPYSNINGNIPAVSDIAKSSYHALNLKLEKRYSSGLNFLVNYTWQKLMGEGGTGPSAFSQNGGTSFVLDNYNLSLERSVDSLDVPQFFVASYGYELPIGPGKAWLNAGGVAGKVFGGWQINGITTIREGFPSDLRTNRLAPIFNTFNVPDRVAGEPTQLPDKSVDGFFNPAAFRVPGTTPSRTGTAINLIGNGGRRFVRGPGSVNFDFSVFKETRITERHTLQFRSEFFNLTNTPTFFLPSGSNRAMTCIGPAPGSACNAGNTEFGLLSSGTATGRQIQFGMKLVF